MKIKKNHKRNKQVTTQNPATTKQNQVKYFKVERKEKNQIKLEILPVFENN